MHHAKAKECPARHQKFRNCNKLGHLATVCRSKCKHDKYRAKLSEGTNSVTVLILGHDFTQWKGIYVDIGVDNMTLCFLIDTRSSLLLLSEGTFQRHFASHRLTDVTVTLLDCSKKRIHIKGCFLADVMYRNTRTSVLFHAVENSTSLLGLNAIQNLQLSIQGDIPSAVFRHQCIM